MKQSLNRVGKTLMVLLVAWPLCASETEFVQELLDESKVLIEENTSAAKEFVEASSKDPQELSEKEQLNKQLNGGKTCKEDMPCQARSLHSKSPHADDKGLYIFVSFSLPERVIKDLSRQALRVGGTLVLRGLVDNDILKTAQKIQALGVDVEINPPLFETFKVEVVPTFVLKKSEQTYDKISGNVPLEEALETFAKGGEMQDMAGTLRGLLKQEGQ